MVLGRESHTAWEAWAQGGKPFAKKADDPFEVMRQDAHTTVA